MWINVDPNLLLSQPTNLNLGDLINCLDLVFQIFSKFLQLFQTILSRQVDIHNREFREIKLEYIRIGREIIRQLRFCPVYRVFHFSKGILNRRFRIKLDNDGCIVLYCCRVNMFNFRNIIDLFFNLAGNEVFHIDRRIARIGNANINRWLLDFRVAILRQALVGEHTHNRYDHREKDYGNTILQ